MQRFLLVLVLLLCAGAGAQQSTSSAGSDLRRGRTIQFASIDISTSGDNTIVAADASNKIKVLSYVFVANGTVNTAFKSGASTALSGAMPLVVNAGVSSPMGSPAGGWLMETAVNQALVINLSAAVAVRGHLSYFLEP